MQYLEEPLEGRVGDVVDLENVLLLVIVTILLVIITIFNQHHGVNEGVHSRQLGVWSRNKQHNTFAQYFFLWKKKRGVW